MAVSEDRKYTKSYIYNLLEGVKGKTLKEVDSSLQFDRTDKSKKITGIAGDVIEQSVFKYKRDSMQECDIMIDGVLTELKTTGIRIPKSEIKNVKGKVGKSYNIHLSAKEGISITGVTFEPTIETDFSTSHFWGKAERLLIIFYEYKSYDVVPSSNYADFPIIDYCYNTFSEIEKQQLQNDWEIVRDYLQGVYNEFNSQKDRNEKLEGFTHLLRPNLLLIELVPGFKKKNGGSYQKPRYRLKQTFVNHIVKGHFNKEKLGSEVRLKDTFTSFSQLDTHCHLLTNKYKGMTLAKLKHELSIDSQISIKNFNALCVLKMFKANCKRLNDISDFTKAGIIAKTITITLNGERTEDMKLQPIDFGEWTDRDIKFTDSTIYNYFCEHSFLCPIFCERGNTKLGLEEIEKTTFEGFKRFSFDDDFINNQVKRMWKDSRSLIHQNKLKWEYVLDTAGQKIRNKSGSYRGA